MTLDSSSPFTFKFFACIFFRSLLFSHILSIHILRTQKTKSVFLYRFLFAHSPSRQQQQQQPPRDRHTHKINCSQNKINGIFDQSECIQELIRYLPVPLLAKYHHRPKVSKTTQFLNMIFELKLLAECSNNNIITINKVLLCV